MGQKCQYLAQNYQNCIFWAKFSRFWSGLHKYVWIEIGKCNLHDIEKMARRRTVIAMQGSFSDFMWAQITIISDFKGALIIIISDFKGALITIISVFKGALITIISDFMWALITIISDFKGALITIISNFKVALIIIISDFMWALITITPKFRQQSSQVWQRLLRFANN